MAQVNDLLVLGKANFLNEITSSQLLRAFGGIALDDSTEQSTALEYVLGIKAFASGGNVMWSSVSDFANVIRLNASGNWGINISGLAAKATADASGNTISSTYAKLKSVNDMVHSSNEWTVVPSGYSGDLYLNYRTCGGTNGAITGYRFCNGAGAISGVTLFADYFSGNASSATKLATARTIFGHSFDGTANVEGQPLVYGSYNSTAGNRYSTGGIQVRENGLVGNAQSDIAYAPAIGFHWGGRVAASLLFHSDGIFYFRKQNFTDRATIDANLNGNATSADKAKLLIPTDNADKVTYGVGTWAANTSGGHIVWREKFIHSGLGSDSGDIVLWLNNATTLNVTIDGYFYQNQSYKVLDTSNVSGSTNYIPKFTATNKIGNSAITDDGSMIVLGRTTRIGSGTINGNSFYQFDSATYRNPGDHTPELLINCTNSTTGILGYRPGLVVYNGHGAQNATAGVSFASREEASAGNAVMLSAIVGIKESAGTNNAWSQGGLRFLTKNMGNLTEAMAITAGGYVGIGTNSPSYKLHVTGDIYANGGWVRVSGDSGFFCESHGGGWHMTDSTYIRSYNGKMVYASGRYLSETTPSSWLDGQRYNNGAYNVNDYSNDGSYNPWMRAKNTHGSVKKYFSFGTLGTKFYWIGSTTDRTDNGYDKGMHFDVHSGYLHAPIVYADRIYSGYDSGETNSISCSNWFRTNGVTGLYNATYGMHLMPNTVSTHGGWRISGTRQGYHGILIGDAKTAMTIMSIDNSHQGLYTESGTGWIVYNKNDSTQIGIRTSSLTSGYNITLGGSTSVTGELYMGNNNITGVNNLSFADPGVQEGITWTGGNGWWIYESPDNLTNGAGNLQFVHGSTRRLTINTDGYVDINARLVVRGNGSSYNEGIRILPASNGWSNVFFSANQTLSETHDGGWLIGRRGAVGGVAGAIGDFTIEEQNSNGSNLTIHKDSNGATLQGMMRSTVGYQVQRTAGDGYGLGFYGSSSHNSYGIHMSYTSTYGKHGAVQGDWANYFCFDGATNRGWIFKQAGTNVASISGTGIFTGSAIRAGNMEMGSKSVAPPVNTTNWYRIFKFAYSNASSQHVILNVSRSYNSPQNEGYLFVISLGYNGDINITQLAGHTGGPIVKSVRVDYTNSGTAYVDVQIAQSGYLNTFYFNGMGHGTFLDPAVTSATQSAQYTFTPGGKGFKTDGWIQTVKYGTSAPSGSAPTGAVYYKLV